MRWKMSNAIFSKFELGKVVATPGALEVLAAAGIGAKGLLDRHAKGDWGDIPVEDKAANTLALVEGERLMSVYTMGPDAGCQRLWVITERDRSVTTILRPDEY
jgi:hypothetical protein